MSKILIVDDEKDIIELLKFNLEKNGYNALVAEDGQSALELVDKQKPDLVLLDWMLPKISGLDVCKQIKNNPSTQQIIVFMVTAKGEEFDKVLALELGADDYICKPFSIREMLARIKAHLRRVSTEVNKIQTKQNVDEKENLLYFEGLSININNHDVVLNNNELHLTKIEFDLLLTMARQPRRVFTRGQLLYQVWGHDFYGDDRVVDVHIRRLRAKLEQLTDREYVQTVRGIGYRFNA
ncbi:MAG: response regulator [Candidatus Margulisbacteria bacterium]|nr:response regulator [Candidatus Margulisiibacteriota bacterium]